MYRDNGIRTGWLGAVAVAVLGAMTLLWTGESQAVPAYAKQTGMNCNSCHNATNPVPNFTHTGRRFSMAGYTQPNVRGELRAGEGGTVVDQPTSDHYGGNYLALNWNSYWSMRFISDIARGSSNSDTSVDPLGRVAMFYTGPMTDWLGLWLEIAYLGNNAHFATGGPATGEKTGVNNFAWDEYRVSATFRPSPNNLYGFSIGNEHPNTIAQWNFPLYAPDMWYTGQGGVGKAIGRGVLNAYGLWANKWWTHLAVDSGAIDTSWEDGRNTYAALMYNLVPTQTNDVWVGAELYWGDDMIPIVHGTSTSTLCTDQDGDGSADCPSGVSDRNFSFTNSAGFTAGNISDIGTTHEVDDFASYKLRADQTVADWGVHTWTAAAVLHGMSQDFVNGGGADRTIIGGSVRYMYNRTYGFEVATRQDVEYEYQASGGGSTVDVETPDRFLYQTRLLYYPAMNVATYFSYSPVEGYALDEANRASGDSFWSLGFEINF